jgi:ankyrin repeat protein
MQYGDLERVQRLVAEGADVKEREGNGYTPFLYAALNCRIPIMQRLLTEGGSSLAEKSVSGNSALLLAADGGCFPAMQRLLEEQGASMTKTNNFGRTVCDRIDLYRRDSNVAAELPPLLR